ncbi:MAG: bifunctional YncE family protein/alkaline phosphatase family protein, partial [Candidatus Hydrogenedentes bacterium]|nr:bifunctional YncE family protein/alkaline phosphatase family protein [Candidatus Hydrogenedentota bacterium]
MRHYLGVLILSALVGCTTVTPGTGLERALDHPPQDFLEQAVVGPAGDGSYVVPTNQKIEPAGEQILYSGRPVALALHPDAQRPLLAALDRKAVVLLDIDQHSVLQVVPLPDPGGSFCGLVWEASGAALWASSAERLVCRAEFDGSQLKPFVTKVELPGPKGSDASAPGGIALDMPAKLLYVTLSRNNTLGVVDLNTLKLIHEVPVGMAPFDVLLHEGKAYVTNWGGRRPKAGDLTGPSSGSQVVIDEAGIAASGTVSVVDLASRSVSAEIEVALHPSGMALLPDGARLYVANANSDLISVIDTNADKAIAAWDAKPMPALPFGSAPNALAVSPDGATLYVANGGNNCIAVMDTASGKVGGLIPTGWYPGAIVLARAGQLLCVANTKGVGSRAADIEEAPRTIRRQLPGNPQGPNFNSHDHLGSVSLIAAPSSGELEEYTYRTACNMRLPRMHEVMNMPAGSQRVTPVPTRPGEVSPIKHVIYIIKENRTYDQVFGDIEKGNGDPSLLHFGREVTPNHHALAEEFVLLDNFYCNGVLSADGHQWATESFVVDYLEKSFGDFTRSYPYEGEDALALASSGFIWDHVLRKGLTFRDYGEMVQATITPKTATWSDIYADFVNGTSNVSVIARTPVRGLEKYICPTFIGFPGKVQDVYRMRIFLDEFRAFEANGTLPNFIIMLLPNDHTSGTRENMPTPRATVADNDLALGQLVDAVSHSRYWPETAIFVVEDDPQAGLDHVDGHRTVALCIGPHIRRGMVDSTHYNQSSMLR